MIAYSTFVPRAKAVLGDTFAKCRAQPLKALGAAILVLSLYAGSVMLAFGMNFWLWSFTPGLKRNYAVMFTASLLWFVLFFVTVLLHALCTYVCYRKVQSYLFWVNKKGIFILFLIGLFDSLTGLCASYATIHVPQILQSALISTGPIWTFILAYLLYPASQPKFNPLLLVVLVFIIAGVAFALIPQALDNSGKKSYFHPLWIMVYLIGTMLFPLYNVLQGRFCYEFKDHASPLTVKLVMLSGETAVQFFMCILYFAVDFIPLVGVSGSARESWENFSKSIYCIFTCKNNAIYMLIYVMGFYIRHIVFAYLNSYSPSVAAATSMLTQPINAFFLLTIPSWNIYGSKKHWLYVFACFICLLFAMLTYLLWHTIFKTLHDEPYETQEKDIEEENSEAK